MELTDLEREFWSKLLGESWVSPPMFDHEIVARLVAPGLVETEPLPSAAALHKAAQVPRGNCYTG